MNCVVLGRFAGAYGIKGWLHIHPFGDSPENWGQLKEWWIKPADDGNTTWQTRSIKGFKAHADGWIVLLEGVEDRTAAESLRGWVLGAPRESLPKVDSGEFYWCDLIGLEVVNLQGESLGQIASLIEAPAQHVMQVETSDTAGEKQERLIPFVAPVVCEVKLEERQVVVDWGSDWD